MAAERVRHSIAAHSSEPLFGVFVEADSDEVQYLVDDLETPVEQPSADAQAALSVIDAWSDMEWEALADSLDRIRHETPPTPPIEL